MLLVCGEEGWLDGRQQSKLQQMGAIRTNIISSVLELLAGTFLFSQVAFLFRCIHQTMPVRELGLQLSCEQFTITKRYAKCHRGCSV